jgi:hypothetical protein
MPDTTLSQAIKEAYASAPVQDIIYHTLEIDHADFTQPVRVVHGWDSITAGGVDWVAMPFELTLPEVSSIGPPTLQIRLDNVGRELMSGLESAAESSTPISITYRAFLLSDLSSAMNNPPMELTLTGVTATATTITATATLADFANRKFPRAVYRDDDFPGLIG